jgi:hypothetical protein
MDGNFIRLEDGTLVPATPLDWCCEFGEAKNNGSCRCNKVKDYKRLENDCDGSSWDKEPIALCDEHAIGHILFNKHKRDYLK